jgi:hypothetical protein
MPWTDEWKGKPTFVSSWASLSWSTVGVWETELPSLSLQPQL